MMKFALVLVLVAALPAQDDWARVESLNPGQRVLVSYAKSFVEGPLVEATADRVVVKKAGQDMTAARVDVKKLWVPAKQRGRNALIGAAIGVGVALGPALFLHRRLDNENGAGSTAAAGVIAIGGGIGAGIGAANRGKTLIYRRR